MALYAYNRDSGTTTTISTRSVIKADFYDTRLDSDGGAWRLKTQDTTWYKEAASATRGPRKEFPVVALITVENFTTHWGVVIYDADDPSFPMWMQLLGGPNMSSETLFRGTDIRDAKMKNAMLVVPTADTTCFVDFITEEHRLGHENSWYWFPERQGLYDRNRQIGEPIINIQGSASGPGSITGGLGTNVNHTVELELPLPGTYDEDKLVIRKGLPFPQALITSYGYGTTYVQFDGDMDLPLAIGNSHSYPGSLENYFMSPQEAVGIHNGPSSGQSVDIYDPRRMRTDYFNGDGGYSVITPDHGWQNALSNYPKMRVYAAGGSQIIKGQERPIQAMSFGSNGDYGFGSTNAFVYNKRDDFFIVVGGGVTHAVKEKKDDPRNGLLCSTTETGTTGWMCGDTVLAMDARNNVDISSTDMISNGYDPTTSNNWSISNTGSLSFTNADFNLTSTSFAGIYQTGITVVPGTSYLISLAWENVSGYSDIDIRIKDNSLGTTYQTITRSGNGALSGVFTAPTGVTSIAIQIIPGRGGVASGQSRINRIRMTEMFFNDFGPYQHHMHATGNFSRGTVPGTDISYFHNFSTSGAQSNTTTGSQLVIPVHNTYMDAANSTGGGMCMMAWVYAPAGMNGYEGVMGIGNSDTSEQFNIGVGSSYGVYFDYGDGNDYCSIGASDFQPGRWVFLVCYVSPRQLGTIMIDGKHIDGYGNGRGYNVRNRMDRDNFMNNYDYQLTIGNVRGGHTTATTAANIRIALPRLMWSIPTDEQVKFIYDQEKPWFQGGNGATGYPTDNYAYNMAANMYAADYDIHRNEYIIAGENGVDIKAGSTRLERLNTDNYDVAAIHDGKAVYGT